MTATRQSATAREPPVSSGRPPRNNRRHVEAVENLKQRAFADSAMQQWTFENDNGRNPQTGIARRYAEHWEEMQAENIGCLFWGNVGNGKSYLAGCIANALMEKEVPVYMTNFAVILGDPLSRLYRPE